MWYKETKWKRITCLQSITYKRCPKKYLESLAMTLTVQRYELIVLKKKFHTSKDNFSLFDVKANVTLVCCSSSVVGCFWQCSLNTKPSLECAWYIGYRYIESAEINIKKIYKSKKLNKRIILFWIYLQNWSYSKSYNKTNKKN